VQYLADSALAPLLKFSVAWPLAYHFCGAFRHAIWDHKMLGFSNKTVRLSSYAVFGISTVLSLAAAGTSLSPNEKKK
jgi:succinate dehydrogenase (ubiquinone) cytochrome b560 subunit